MKVIIYGKRGCIYCRKSIKFCEDRDIDFVYLTLDLNYTKHELESNIGNYSTYPQIVIKDHGSSRAIGGFDQLFDHFD